MTLPRSLFALSAIAALAIGCAEDESPLPAATSDAPSADADLPEPHLVPLPRESAPVRFTLDGDKLDTDAEPGADMGSVLLVGEKQLLGVSHDDSVYLVGVQTDDGAPRLIAGDGLLRVQSIRPVRDGGGAGSLVPALASYSGEPRAALAFVGGDRLIGEYDGRRLIVLRTSHTSGIATGDANVHIVNDALDFEVDESVDFPTGPSLDPEAVDRLKDLLEEI